MQLTFCWFWLHIISFYAKNGKKYTFFIQKLHDHILIMTYLVTIATDCSQTLRKGVLRINEQLLEMA